MPTSTTAIMKAVKNCKGGPTPRSVVKPKPFVVTSLSTKRYATCNRISPQKPSAIPTPASAEGYPTVTRVAAAKRGVRPGSSPHDIPKVAPTPTQHARRSLLRRVLSADMTVCDEHLVPTGTQPELLKMSQTGKAAGGRQPLASVTRVVREPPSRPSCIPRHRILRTSVTASRNIDSSLKASTRSVKQACIPRKFSSDIRAPKAEYHDEAANDNTTHPFTADDYHIALTTSNPMVCSPTVGSATGAEFSPPSSELSSSLFQSQTLVADTGTRLSEENMSGMGVMPKAGAATEASHDSCGGCDRLATASSSPIAFEATPTPEKIDLGGSAKACTMGAVISRTTSSAKIVSPLSNDGPTSPIALLARVIVDHVSSFSRISETRNRTQSPIKGAVEITEAFFSPTRHASSDTETAFFKTISSNVLRLRNFFVPPLEEHAKASKNPMTQMEIEMLRARKKVAGGGVVDPRLERLDSLAAMKIVTRRLETSSSDDPSQL